MKDLPCNYTIKRVEKTSEADLGPGGQIDNVNRMCVGCLQNRFTSFSCNGQAEDLNNNLALFPVYLFHKSSRIFFISAYVFQFMRIENRISV